MFAITGYSQINWYALAGPTTIVEDLVICSDTTYKIYIFNAGTDTIKSNVVDVNLPPSISYIAGSVVETTVVTASNPLKNVVESNISNLNQPFFAFDDIPPNGYVSFDYRVHATCGTATNSVPIPITLNYIDGGTNAPATSSPNSGGTPLNPVNINKASINLVSVTNDNYTGSVGDVYSQTLTLRNAGLGFVDGTTASSAFVYVLLNETSCLEVSNPSIGNLSNDTLWIPLSEFQNIGNLDEYWDNNEDIVFSYDVTINCCSGLTRNVSAQWGCDKSVCETTNAFPANVVIPNLVPNLNVALVNYDNNYCFNGDDAWDGGTAITQTVRIINTGNGPASEIKMNLMNWRSGSTSYSRVLFDTANWVIKDASGNILGNMGDMTVTRSAPYYNKAVCGGGKTTVPDNVRMTSPFILGAGDTILIEIPTYGENLNCYGNCNGNLAYPYITTDLSYQNQCGNANYTLPQTTLRAEGYTLLGNGSEMPTDLQDGQCFTYEVAYDRYNTTGLKSAADSRVWWCMDLDNKGLLVSGAPTLLHSGNTVDTLNYFELNDSLCIELPANTGRTGAVLRIPMCATCADGGGSKSVNYGHDIFYDTTCVNPAKFHAECGSNTYVLHCPQPCPTGGATPVNFSLTRTTLGLPDDNNNGSPSGTLDSSLIKFHRAVQGDTLLGHWEIVVYPNVEPTSPNVGLDFPYTFVEFDLGAPLGGASNTATTAVEALPNAVVTIYPNGGGAPINCTVSPTIVGRDARYDLSTCKASWEGGDSIVMDAQFIARASLENGGFKNYVTDNHVYSSYVATPAANSYASQDPFLGERHTCDHYNDYMLIYNIYTSHYQAAQFINGCSNNLWFNLRRYINVQAGAVWFPFEYRAFDIPDTFFVKVDPAFDYRPGTADLAYAGAGGTVAIPDANVNRVGNYLVFSGLKNLFTTYGGTLEPEDEVISTAQVNFSVDPTCEAIPNTTYPIRFNATVEGNVTNIPAPYNPAWNTSTANDSSANVTATYRGPDPFLSGGGTIAVTGEEACWNVNLNNGSNQIDAPNSWFYLEALQGLPLDSVVVTYGATTAPENNGFYLLGDNLKSGSKTFEICGKLQDCDTVKILVHSGWGCDTYPIFFDSTLCYETDTLIVYSFPAGTDATFNVLATGPNGTVNFCDTFEVELIMNANQLGDLNTLANDFILPFGFSADLSAIQIQYPAGTGYRTPSNPAAASASGAIVNVDIDAIDSTLSDGILGSYDIPGKEVRIKLPLYSECGAVSGDVVKVAYNANAACSDALPEILKESAPIIFAQATVPGYITNPNGTMDTVKGCDPATVYTYTVNIPISSTGANSSALDSILVSLPPGVVYSNYDPIAAGQTNQPTVAPNGPVDLGTGALRYSWPMTGGLTTGDFIQYDIEVTFDYSEFISCNANLNNFEISTGGNTAVVCNGVNCTVTSINGRGSSGLTIALPEIEASVTASPDCIADPANNAYTLTTDIEVCNNSSVADVPAGTTITVDIYCDVNANTSLDAADTYISSVTTSAAIPANGCLTIPSNSISYTCPGGALLAVINRLPQNNGPEQCLCLPETATDWTCNVAGFLPVDILKFVGHPLENGDNLLNWTVTDEKYVSHYDVERSEDGDAFEKIGEVLATNETQDHQYDFIDGAPYPIGWYRLRSQDIDGQYAYSNTIKIRRSDIQTNGVYLYPNPAKTAIKFVYETTEDDVNVRIQLLDMTGRTIQNQTSRFGQNYPIQTIDIESLAEGNYIIQYTNTDTRESGYVKFTKK